MFLKLQERRFFQVHHSSTPALWHDLSPPFLSPVLSYTRAGGHHPCHTEKCSSHLLPQGTGSVKTRRLVGGCITVTCSRSSACTQVQGHDQPHPQTLFLSVHFLGLFPAPTSVLVKILSGRGNPATLRDKKITSKSTDRALENLKGKDEHQVPQRQAGSAGGASTLGPRRQ